MVKKSRFRVPPKGRDMINAPQMVGKYKNLAKEALAVGDHIQAENYYQHVEHFQRIINDRAPEPKQEAPQA